MKISHEDEILIKNLSVNVIWCTKAVCELPDEGWKLGSIDSLLKRIHTITMT